MLQFKGEIAKNKNFYKTKGSRKKIKIMRIKLKNIIPLIWTQEWNWKPIIFLQKDQGKQIKNPKTEDQIKEYNIW